MSRDASGNYTLPIGNPVISGTIIDSTWANDTMSDLGNEMTDSLSRSGQGGMLAELGIVNGTGGSPGLQFIGETNTGLYRFMNNDIRMSVGGNDIQVWTATSFISLVKGIFTGPNPDLVSSNAALTTGGSDPGSDQHIAFGESVIQSKLNGITVSDLFLNPLGGDVHLGPTGAALGSTFIYDDGDVLFRTKVNVCEIVKNDDLSATELSLIFEQQNGDQLGSLGFFGSNNFTLRNELAGSSTIIEGDNSVFLNTTVGGVVQQFAGLNVVNTTTAANGGLAITNDLTGIGSERALSASDRYEEPLAISGTRNITGTDAKKWLFRNSAGDFDLTLGVGIFVNEDRFVEITIDNITNIGAGTIDIIASGVTILGNVQIAADEIYVLKQLSSNVYRLAGG